MKNFGNRAAHFAIGFAVGVCADKPSAPIAGATFLAYQAIEAYTKGDAGYPEVKEYAYGMGIGIAVRWTWRALARRPQVGADNGRGVHNRRDSGAGAVGAAERAAGKREGVKERPYG